MLLPSSSSSAAAHCRGCRCSHLSQCSGRQLFFYKRAQIFVGDVWGAFHGTGLGCFHDIDQLTMFAGGCGSWVVGRRAWGLRVDAASPRVPQPTTLQVGAGLGLGA